MVFSFTIVVHLSTGCLEELFGCFEARSIGALYPCALSEGSEAELVELARELVKAWGDRALTVLELEDRIGLS